MSKYSFESSFLGHKTPKEIKLLNKQLKSSTKDDYCESIGQVVQYATAQTVPDFSKILDATKQRTLFAGFYCIVTNASRHRNLPLNTFSSALQDVNIPQEVIDNLVKVLYKNKELVSLKTGTDREDDVGLKFSGLDWRLDVVLSSNSLAKVLQPEIMMGIKVKGEEKPVRLHLSQQEFNNLRQSTAKLLHDMCQLKERKFMNPK